MWYLIGSIVFTSYLTLSFKALQRLKIDPFEAIVFNYITCVITGSVFNRSFPLNAETTREPWFLWALAMGGVFIMLFNLIGYTARVAGVAVTSVANKLSLVIPFLFSLYLYNETAGNLKVLGICLALIAVTLACYPSKKTTNTTRSAASVFLPVALFLGSGLLDTMINHVEVSYLGPADKNNYLVLAFFSAASIGTILLVARTIILKKKLSYRPVIAGICIGIPNYFSIWCLLRVLELNPGRTSAILPINNVGIVLFSTIAAFFLFRERLSFINAIGIVVAVAAIILIGS